MGKGGKRMAGCWIGNLASGKAQELAGKVATKLVDNKDSYR